MTTTFTDIHPYRGLSEIDFFLDDQGGLSVTIYTERLYIRSVEPTVGDCERYGALFGDRLVMEKYGPGTTKTRLEMQTHIHDVWVKRWRENDPYSSLAIFRNDTDDFLGHVILGHGDAPGESEIAYLFHRTHWGNGYGSETAAAIVKEYAPATVKEGYTLDGKPLEKIVATARPDNPASVRILEKVGMHFVRTEEKFGAVQRHYSIEISEL